MDGPLGEYEGLMDGAKVGEAIGAIDGVAVGQAEGNSDGFAEGAKVGAVVEGAEVGCPLGDKV